MHGINSRLNICKDFQNLIPQVEDDVKINYPKPPKRVDPFPGICIKTWTDSDDKVFINICHSKEICAPEDISDEKFNKILMEDTPSFVIPMAIGTEKMTRDKEDIERSTFDILINTKYFEKCMEKPHFLQFTITAIIESINDKYNKNLNFGKYVILKNKKVTGSLDVFTIEDRKPKKPTLKKPLIQVLESNQNTEKYTKTNKKSVNDEQQSKPQNYVFLKSKSQENLIGLFYLSTTSTSFSITDITADVGESHIIVENQKTGSIIDTYIPYSIDKDHVDACYDSILHILRLTLPLKKK